MTDAALLYASTYIREKTGKEPYYQEVTALARRLAAVLGDDVDPSLTKIAEICGLYQIVELKLDGMACEIRFYDDAKQGIQRVEARTIREALVALVASTLYTGKPKARTRDESQ